jgi:hypothetical protein
MLLLVLWNLAGVWTFDRGDLTLRVKGDGTVTASFEQGSHLVVSSRKDGKLQLAGYDDLNALRDKRVAWTCELVQVSDQELRCGSSKLHRKQKMKILPAEAVRIALTRMKVEPAQVSISLNANEWWVHLPRGQSSTMPAELTVAVDIKTGAARGPFGR